MVPITDLHTAPYISLRTAVVAVVDRVRSIAHPIAPRPQSVAQAVRRVGVQPSVAAATALAMAAQWAVRATAHRAVRARAFRVVIATIRRAVRRARHTARAAVTVAVAVRQAVAAVVTAAATVAAVTAAATAVVATVVAAHRLAADNTLVMSI